MILFLALQAAAPTPSPAIEAYRVCVQQSAVKFERAKEAASDTAEVAIAACEDMRVKSRADDLGKRQEGSVFTAKDYRDLTFQIWDKVTEIERRKALIAIFNIRSKNAQNH